MDLKLDNNEGKTILADFNISLTIRSTEKS
jgi:hypothetical protein